MCEGNKRIFTRLAISYTVGHVNCMASAPQGVKLLFTAHCTLYNNPLVLPLGQFCRIAVNQNQRQTEYIYIVTLRCNIWDQTNEITTDCFDLNIPAVMPMSRQSCQRITLLLRFSGKIEFIYAQMEFLFLNSSKRECWHFFGKHFPPEVRMGTAVCRNCRYRFLYTYHLKDKRLKKTK